MKTSMHKSLARLALPLVAIAVWGTGATAQDLLGHYGGPQCLYDYTFKDKGVVYIQTSSTTEVRGQYRVDGNKVSVTAPGGLDAVFTRKGNALETTFMGDTAVCTKVSDVGSASPQATQVPAAVPRASSTDLAAMAFIRAAVDSHWVRGPDGWTTKYRLPNNMGQRFAQGGGGEPKVLYTQYRAINFTVQPREVSEAQRLNGVDYRGIVIFERTASRVYRTFDTLGGRWAWSVWEGVAAPGGVDDLMAFERRNGQWRWLIERAELLEGLKPDLAKVPSGHDTR